MQNEDWHGQRQSNKRGNGGDGLDEKQIGCVSICITAVFGVAATLISIIAAGFAFQANQISQEANRQSVAAQASVDRNAAADRQQQSDLANFQQYIKRPLLAALRFERISESEYRAVVQNTGERQAAVFGLQFVPQDVKGVGPATPDTSAVIPIENTARTIAVDFVNGKSWKHEFQNVVVMPAGEVVVFRIKVAPLMRMGEFVLHFGEYEQLSIGVITASRIATEQSVDDLFGSPPPSR